MSKSSVEMWDTAKARKLYDQGMGWVDIAARLGISRLALTAHAKRQKWQRGQTGSSYSKDQDALESKG